METSSWFRRMIRFFLQAEDVILELVRSRGLGDVYKRQELAAAAPLLVEVLAFHAANDDEPSQASALNTVSYTHLTLTTIYSVLISVVAVSLKKKHSTLVTVHDNKS